MNYYDVKRFALVLAIQAEIEGMKAENQTRSYDKVPAYIEIQFKEKAEQLRSLAYLHDEQL